jgi:aminoglycoside/choline kinase family phosphotransferase
VFSVHFRGKIVIPVIPFSRLDVMDQRQQALEQWLAAECDLASYQMRALPGDASFRRYFRLQSAGSTMIAMDAPPERENCRPFVAIASSLRDKNLCAPEVIASDFAQGFLLLTDFGDRLYLKELNSNNASELYSTALDTLAVLQTCQNVPGWKLPNFTADFMYQELQIFKEWFLLRYLNLSLTPEQETMLSEFFYFLANSASTQTQVFMHRDFHSANLMCLPDRQVGILDFQDAFIGPVTYDLVSLLRDCYIDWPEAFVTEMVLQYKTKIGSAAPVSDEIFMRWFDLMGLQRHLKALLTFARKFHRDGIGQYLQFIPRTVNYVATICPRYPEAAPFNEFLTRVVMPQQERISLCEQ